MSTTSTANYPGILTPTFAKKRLDVEKKKVEARKQGQMRALQRL